MDCTEKMFLKDVGAHQMTIIRDDGVHRHIRFAKPTTSCMHFDLITWPGYLCYTGDMGTYVFRRLHDMFEFFRTDREHMHLRDGKTLAINLGYWAEKLEGVDRGDGYEQFDSAKFRRVVNEYRIRWMREMKDSGFDKDDRRELWEAVEGDVLNRADDGEAGALSGAHEFTHHVGGDSFQFDDFFEHRFNEYSHRFVWCCYALAWGIQQYDRTKDAQNAI